MVKIVIAVSPPCPAEFTTPGPTPLGLHQAEGRLDITASMCRISERSGTEPQDMWWLADQQSR